MSLSIPVATVRIARELNQAETAIDQALVATAALMHSSTIARVDNPEINAACGHTALMRMHKTFGGLLAARADMLRAHVSLRSDAREYAGADEPTCPEDDAVFTGAELLEGHAQNFAA